MRAFYREQDKEVSRKVDPDVDTQTLLKILSVPNPVVRIAKHRKLSFTTTEGDATPTIHVPLSVRSKTRMCLLLSAPYHFSNGHKKVADIRRTQWVRQIDHLSGSQ